MAPYVCSSLVASQVNAEARRLASPPNFVNLCVTDAVTAAYRTQVEVRYGRETGQCSRSSGSGRATACRRRSSRIEWECGPASGMAATVTLSVRAMPPAVAASPGWPGLDDGSCFLYSACNSSTASVCRSRSGPHGSRRRARNPRRHLSAWRAISWRALVRLIRLGGDRMDRFASSPCSRRSFSEFAHGFFAETRLMARSIVEGDVRFWRRGS